MDETRPGAPAPGEPERWLEAARRLAAGELRPGDLPEGPPADAPRPLLRGVRASARGEALWAVLGCPGRAAGLAWLDTHGILDEIVAGWEAVRGRISGAPDGGTVAGMHLAAVEALHREGWAGLLEPGALRRVCERMDEPVAPGVNGWAAVACAILLRALSPSPLEAAARARVALERVGTDPAAARTVEATLACMSAAATDLPPEFAPHAVLAHLCFAEVLHGAGSPGLLRAAEAARAALRE